MLTKYLRLKILVPMLHHLERITHSANTSCIYGLRKLNI